MYSEASIRSSTGHGAAFLVQLTLVHKILIGSAIGLGVLFGAYSFSQYAKTGQGASLALGVGSLVVAAALGFYLRAFIRKTRRP